MLIHPTRRRMIALTCAVLWTGAARAESSNIPPTQTIEGRAFASQWRISAPAGADIERHRRAIEALLDRVDGQMSPWRDDSDLTRFNNSQRESAISPEAAIVARAALEIARDSGGWFDPTVGPLVAQWGFGRITGSNAGQWEGLSVGDNSLRKDAPGLTMDLCGIAKGHALDLMATHLLEAGERDFLIDLGGELKSAGFHPSGRDWQVAVEDPRQSQDGPAAGLRLPSGMAVATSGMRAQSYALGNNRYSHIINPRLARPVAGRIASVSVLRASAMDADGWATALAAAGEGGPRIARANGVAALFLFNTDGVLSLESTGGFDRHMI